MPNSRMQDRVLETYARSLMEAAKAEDRVFRDLNEFETISNAAPEIFAVLMSLFERGQLDLLPQIVATFKEMTEEDEDVVGVTVTTAVPLDDELRRTITEKCEGDLGRKVFLIEKVDPSIRPCTRGARSAPRHLGQDAAACCARGPRFYEYYKRR